MSNLVFKRFLCVAAAILFMSAGMAWPAPREITSFIRPLASMENEGRNPLGASADFARKWNAVVDEMIQAADPDGNEDGMPVLEALGHILAKDGAPIERGHKIGIERILSVFRNHKISDPAVITVLIRIATTRAEKRLWEAFDRLPLVTAPPRPSDV